jgi:hypothetical protein
LHSNFDNSVLYRVAEVEKKVSISFGWKDFLSTFAPLLETGNSSLKRLKREI